MSAKGTLILTEGRSGSNWLGSLANGTGDLGRSEEWVDKRHSGVAPGEVPVDAFIDTLLRKSSTQNGYFCIKLFPRHLFTVNEAYDCDLITELSNRFDIRLIVLEREDRVAQAISFAKAYQSGQWRSTVEKKTDPEYSFDMTIRSYFFIERSYAFWRNYLDLRQIEASFLTYEALLPDPVPYLDLLARHAGVDVAEIPESPLSVQRNPDSDAWRARFESDLKTRNFLSAAVARPPVVTGSNLVNFLRSRPMKPKPFTW